MSVFISWSGRDSHSHKVAILLKEWLPKVLQKLPCFLSSHDIEAGAAWIKVLFEQLEESNVGVICLTRSTLAKPWILFEAGALAKKIEASRLCPLLIDLAPSDVEFPLAAFQLKTVAREDVRSLVSMINKSREASLTDEEFAEVFDLRWPFFENRLREIRKEPEQATSVNTRRSDSELLNEILSLTRGIASQTASLAQPPPNTSSERESRTKGRSAAADRIWNHVMEQVRKRRPLIRGWLETVDSVDLSEDGGLLRVWFPPKAESAYQAVQMPRNTNFIQSLVHEIAPTTRLEWDELPF